MSTMRFTAEFRTPGAAFGSGASTRLGQAIVEAVRPHLYAAGQVGGQVGVNAVAQIAGENMRSDYRPKGNSKSLRDPSSYSFTLFNRGRGVVLLFKVTGSDDFMAKFWSVNNGSGAHSIDPVRARRLKFPRTNDPVGQIISVPHVNHPGSGKAKKMWEKGLERGVAAAIAAL
jgi:hypothetical protein